MTYSTLMGSRCCVCSAIIDKRNFPGRLSARVSRASEIGVVE